MIAAAAYVVALFLPQIATCSWLVGGGVELHWFDQTTVVFFGWGGVTFLQYAWFANLTAVLIGVRVWHRVSVAPALSIAHAALATSAVLPVPLAHNEGFKEPVCLAGYGPGFWMWLGAQALILLAAGLDRADCGMRMVSTVCPC